MQTAQNNSFFLLIFQISYILFKGYLCNIIIFVIEMFIIGGVLWSTGI